MLLFFVLLFLAVYLGDKTEIENFLVNYINTNIYIYLYYFIDFKNNSLLNNNNNNEKTQIKIMLKEIFSNYVLFNHDIIQ